MTYLDYYLKLLDYDKIPIFLEDYLRVPALLRLKKIGYFCGMDYASSDIYNFREYISRYDHSLTTSLLTWKLTHDKVSTIAALFHDIATPCFSHVIDYMNGDYEKQESTEEYTDRILRNDSYLMECLNKDGISIEDIACFKQYSIVDNDRPSVCADRIDGVILTGIGWTKNIGKNDIKGIVNDLCVVENENGEMEIGFKSKDVALKVVEVSHSIDRYCHSNADNYMMELLSKITRLSIMKGIITYDDLYVMDEEFLLDLIKSSNDLELNSYIDEFEHIKISDIPTFELSNVKVRELKPLVNGRRIFGCN